MRVLVVDDQLAMAEMVAEGLVDHGLEARMVTSGREALAVLRAEHVDAVVTDLRMPDVDGLQIVARSLELDARRPVVVMTAYGAVEATLDSGVRARVHWVEKPFRVETLVQLLRNARSTP